MEHITIDSEAFTVLCEQIDLITDYITKENGSNNEEDVWIDNHDACKYLSISERTLYRQ